MDSKLPSPPRIGRRILPAAGLVLLVLTVYADPLWTGNNFVGRDLVPYGLPMEKSIHEAWSRGRIPVWCPNISGGRPIFPNPNTGTLYPVRPLLATLPFPLAMRLFPILHWASSGIGMYVLLRALAASPAAAWVGAATFVFSGVSVSQVFYQPFGPAVALQPWLLWALVRPGEPRRKAVRLALLWGLAFLLGDVFAIAVALLAAVLWIALGAAPGARRRELAILGLGLGLAALLGAPQIVATALLVPETQRAVIGLKFQEVFAFSLSPWRLLELAVPFPFGELWTLEKSHVWGASAFRCLYGTIYCGAFALVAVAAIWRARERQARFCRGLVVAGALLAMSGSFVPARWGTHYSWIPLRYPEKFAVAMVLGLALAAGLAFDRFRGAARRPAWILGVAIAITLFASAVRLFPDAIGAVAMRAVGAIGTTPRETGEQLPGAFAEAGLMWVATIVALELVRRPGRRRVAICAALLTLVPIAATRRITPTESPSAIFPPTAFARAIALRDPTGTYRTVDEASYQPDSPLKAVAGGSSPWSTALERRDWATHTPELWGRGTVFNIDFDRGDFSRLDGLRTISSIGASQPLAIPFFESLSLRFGIRYRDQSSFPGFQRFGGDASQDWDENPGALPDIRLLGRWTEEPSGLAALADLPRLGEGDVVLETGRQSRGAARPGVVRILERSPERLRVETASRDPGWLFVLRGYWRYRTVRVDGEEVECLPAQLAFSAIPVPAGVHAIDWREEIPGAAASFWGPAIFALVAVGMVLPRRAREALP